MSITHELTMVLLLIMARLIGLFQLAPPFTGGRMLGLVKISLSFWMATMIAFFIPMPAVLPHTLLTLLLSLLVEFMIGYMFGLVAHLTIAGVEMAGSFIDTQAGISSASLLDPIAGHQTTLISKLLKEMTILLFLILNGHHMLLSAIRRSFDVLPVGGFPNFTNGMQHLAQLGSDVFLIAIQFAIPMILVIFLVDFGFGMLSRVAPQINVFQLEFQLKPILMMMTLMVLLPGIVSGTQHVIEKILGNMVTLLGLMST